MLYELDRLCSGRKKLSSFLDVADKILQSMLSPRCGTVWESAERQCGGQLISGAGRLRLEDLLAIARHLISVSD
jgi:hypothetical protein